MASQQVPLHFPAYAAGAGHADIEEGVRGAGEVKFQPPRGSDGAFRGGRQITAGSAIRPYPERVPCARASSCCEAFMTSTASGLPSCKDRF